MPVYVSASVCMYVHSFEYDDACVHVPGYRYTLICMQLCLGVCRYGSKGVCICIQACESRCAFLGIYVDVCQGVCIYMYMFV